MAQVQRLPRHQDNRLLAALANEDLAALEPHLAFLELQRGQVLYEPGETVTHTYFPHDAMVSLVTVMSDGKSAEMAVFGCEGLFGLVSAFVTRQAFGRYIVQLGGSASRIELARMHEAMAARPAIQRLVMRFTEVLMAQTLQSVACNAVHGVEARCCRWILMSQDRVGKARSAAHARVFGRDARRSAFDGQRGHPHPSGQGPDPARQSYDYGH